GLVRRDDKVIMSDCQHTYVREVMALDGVAAALDDAPELLERARSASIPIIHPDGCLQPRPKPQWNGALRAAMTVFAGQLVVFRGK
ncbi:MAG TPA: hypothetical protein VNR66_10190, partial [Solirubrobacteraceae bacterium]|nr:hypothetical protein [Solirubrobacteraceae bacterium]